MCPWKRVKPTLRQCDAGLRLQEGLSCRHLESLPGARHNGGEAKKTKIADYVKKTIPAWEHTYCVRSSKAEAVYIKLSPLKP